MNTQLVINFNVTINYPDARSLFVAYILHSLTEKQPPISVKVRDEIILTDDERERLGADGCSEKGTIGGNRVRRHDPVN